VTQEKFEDTKKALSAAIILRRTDNTMAKRYRAILGIKKIDKKRFKFYQ
jgi:hypothetical protein